MSDKKPNFESEAKQLFAEWCRYGQICIEDGDPSGELARELKQVYERGQQDANADLLDACLARITFDTKVCLEPGVDEGPLPASRIQDLAIESAKISEMMVNAIARATGAK